MRTYILIYMYYYMHLVIFIIIDRFLVYMNRPLFSKSCNMLWWSGKHVTAAINTPLHFGSIVMRPLLSCSIVMRALLIA